MPGLFLCFRDQLKSHFHRGCSLTLLPQTSPYHIIASHFVLVPYPKTSPYHIIPSHFVLVPTTTGNHGLSQFFTCLFIVCLPCEPQETRDFVQCWIPRTSNPHLGTQKVLNKYLLDK